MRSNVWFTADTHLGHANIIRYCKRPFLNDEERDLFQKGIEFRVSDDSISLHDQTIIARINEKVKKHDTLWVLGDFTFGPFQAVRDYLARINCDDVRLIWGNHDRRSVAGAFNGEYERVDMNMQLSNGTHQPIVLDHYPLASWNRSHHGSWHLHGHVHGNLSSPEHMLRLDVGVDCHNFYPLSLDEVAEHMAKKQTAWLQYRKSWPSRETGGMAPGSRT